MIKAEKGYHLWFDGLMICIANIFVFSSKKKTRNVLYFQVDRR